MKTWQVIKKRVNAEDLHLTIWSLAEFMVVSFLCPRALELKCATAWR
jgi:hypothetical protein